MRQYEPSGERAKKLLAVARATNEKRDREELKYGFAPPLMADFDVFLTTVLSALEAGLERKNWPCVAEAMDMLMQAERKLQEDSRVDRN